MRPLRRHVALLAACVVTLVGLLAWLAPHLVDTVTESAGAQQAGGGPSGATRPRGPGTIVGLGDSVMSGTACDCEPFLTSYAAQLGSRQGRPLRAINLGVDGSTTAELARSVRDEVSTRSAISGASVIVVTTGANDLEAPLDAFVTDHACDDDCIAGAVATMQEDLARALAAIKAAKPASTQVLVTTYWNVYPAGAAGEADYGPGFEDLSLRVTNAANRAIAQSAEAAGATVVDLVAAFGSGRDQDLLLLPDGDHQDAAGNEVITRALLAATVR